MTNLPEPRRDIMKFPDNPRKATILKQLTNTEEYNKLSYFRDQIGYLYFSSIPFTRFTYSDLADMFGISIPTVQYHYNCYKKDKEAKEKNELRKNGRPFTLTDKETETVKQWLDSLKYSPKFSELKNMVMEAFSKELNYNSYILLLSKLGYQIIRAKPIEDNRFYVTTENIDLFYSELDAFSSINNIPSSLCFNIDEEGYDEFAMAIDELIIIPSEKTAKGQFFPVSRKSDHTTFVGAINAFGDYIKPLIVTKRQTVELELLRRNIGPEKVMLKTTDKGYVTQETFDEWFVNVFCAKVRELREHYHYNGPGIIILDGASAHFSQKFFSGCADLNLYVMFLPAHSSNQTQPLDLGMFHLHKNKIRHLDFTSLDESKVVEAIIKLIHSWDECATQKNIIGAWECMGAVYEIGGPSCTYVRFKKEFALKLLDHIKSPEEKKSISNQRKEYGYNKQISSKRIELDDFNNLSSPEKLSPKAKKLFRTPKVESTLSNKSSLSTLVHQAICSCDVATEYPMKQNHHKWKNPKTPEEKDWTALSFEKKLELELQSIGIL